MGDRGGSSPSTRTSVNTQAKRDTDKVFLLVCFLFLLLPYFFIKILLISGMIWINIEIIIQNSDNIAAIINQTE